MQKWTIWSKIAQNEVYKNGYNYPVKAEIVNMHFDTRHYAESVRKIFILAQWYPKLRQAFKKSIA